ncbi:hypothetical protein C8F01DRAFT_1331550 [Mycena amicta]|nr:hypothetical protein C8F01DRAFT_1331550 [Mycena amicta]
MPSLDIVTGALLVGTWVNSLLYSIELTQLIYYFLSFPNDDWRVKALVLTAWLIDTVAAVANYAGVYLYTITHAGDQLYLSVQNWTVPLLVFATGLVAVLVQSFLVVRYWRLYVFHASSSPLETMIDRFDDSTKNIFVTLFLFVLIAAALAASFITGVILCRFPAYVDRRKLTVPATAWLVAEAVTDVLIALSLLWELRKVRSAFEETKSMITRLATKTIQTGAAGATVAVAALIAYLVNEESNVPLGIAYSLGRVYVLTMLSNLNVRAGPNGGTSGSRGTSSGGAAGRPPGNGGAGLSTRGHPDGTFHEDLGGIHVHRTAVVQIDPALAIVPLRNNSDKTLPDSQTNRDSEFDAKTKDSTWFSNA